MKHQEQPRKRNSRKRRKRILIIRSTLVTVVLLSLLAVISYAWFIDRSNIATLVDVLSPANVAILGPHGEAMTALDMSYTDEDKDADGRVTIRRVVSVASNQDLQQLEIVHTTNLKGLTFKLYRATETETSESGITEAGYTYSYNTAAPIAGAYINQKSENDSYRYADNSKHTFNYEEYETSLVQAHAEPIYWLANGNLEATECPKDNTNVDTKYLTYYVIEISWQETTKETDIFYLLARNA